MNYQLKQAGENLGIFTLDELRRLRSSGDLTGGETVWKEGMKLWEPLDSVLRETAFPPGPTPLKKPRANWLLIIAVAVAIGVLLVGAILIWLKKVSPGS